MRNFFLSLILFLGISFLLSNNLDQSSSLTLEQAMQIYPLMSISELNEKDNVIIIKDDAGEDFEVVEIDGVRYVVKVSN